MAVAKRNSIDFDRVAPNETINLKYLRGLLLVVVVGSLRRFAAGSVSTRTTERHDQSKNSPFFHRARAPIALKAIRNTFLARARARDEWLANFSAVVQPPQLHGGFGGIYNYGRLIQCRSRLVFSMLNALRYMDAAIQCERHNNV